MKKNKQRITGKKVIVYLLVVAILAAIVVCVSGHYNNLPAEIKENDLETVFNGVKESIISNPLSYKPLDLELTKNWLILFGAAVAFATLVILSSNKEKRRYGEEYGSAEWMNSKQRRKFTKKFTKKEHEDRKLKSVGRGNRILSQNVRLTNDIMQTYLNNNEVVIGGSGTGKSRFFVKPNILQANGSYIVTDPAGDILRATGSFLEKEKYEIKVFNLVEMDKSCGYNPFHYIRKQEDVLKLVRVFIENTEQEGTSKGESFWLRTEQMFFSSLVNYLREVYPITDDLTEEEKNYNIKKQSFPEVFELMKLESVNEDNPSEKSELEILMNDLEEQNPRSLAVEGYKGFRQAAGKTLKSILITARARMDPFTSSPSIKNLMRVDEMELDMVGNKKTAIFIIVPVADSTYNFLASMMYTQLFETLYHKAETEYGGQSLPIQVSFYLDEFANLGVIPDFDKKLSTVRKYGINVKIILQSLAQIKSMYNKTWEGIMGNCDTLVYLGGNEQTSHEYISKRLGKETITQVTSSRSFSKTDSNSINRGLLGRELMTSDEVGLLDNKKSILIIRGQLPIIDDKYDYTKHPNYKLTGDYKDKLIYKIKTQVRYTKNDELEQLVESPIKDFSFLNTFSTPEVRELDEIFSKDEIEQYKMETYYIKSGDFNDVEIYSMSFGDFVEASKQPT